MYSDMCMRLRESGTRYLGMSPRGGIAKPPMAVLQPRRRGLSTHQRVCHSRPLRIFGRKAYIQARSGDCTNWPCTHIKLTSGPTTTSSSAPGMPITSAAPGRGGADRGDDGRRDRGRIDLRLDGAAGRRLAHGDSCRCARHRRRWPICSPGSTPATRTSPSAPANSAILPPSPAPSSSRSSRCRSLMKACTG